MPGDRVLWWVDVKGKVLKESKVEKNGASYLVVWDEEIKMAVFIELAENSSLLNSVKDK